MTYKAPICQWVTLKRLVGVLFDFRFIDVDAILLRTNTQTIKPCIAFVVGSCDVSLCQEGTYSCQGMPLLLTMPPVQCRLSNAQASAGRAASSQAGTLCDRPPVTVAVTAVVLWQCGM